MMYRLPSLHYRYDALEPYLDAETMRIHYERHHGSYVNNLNSLLQGIDRLTDKTLEEILANIAMLPEEIRQSVRNFGGGHLNHCLFWHVMGPPRDTRPAGALEQAIVSTFGDVEALKNKVTQAALDRFGSGWGWLCLDWRGRLEVLSTPNQDSPIMLGYRPILGVDVWEHAYYLHYQSRRADYLAAWWHVVDWDNVADLYEHALSMAAPHSEKRPSVR